MRVKRRYIPNIARDMAECDANYLRLRRLFPDLSAADETAFGVEGLVECGATVRFEVHERNPYTTTLAIRVATETDTPFIRWPYLQVRIYHDVKSAEVIQFERHRNFNHRYPIPNKHMFAPDEKAQINRFLGELLTFCIAHGHSLTPVEFS